MIEPLCSERHQLGQCVWANTLGELNFGLRVLIKPKSVWRLPYKVRIKDYTPCKYIIAVRRPLLAVDNSQ
jgi:hypothetical protein